MFVNYSFKGPSYSGGGSIAFIGTLGKGAEFATRLFHGELPLGKSALHLTYSVSHSLRN